MEAHIKRRLHSPDERGKSAAATACGRSWRRRFMKLPVVDSDPMGRAYPEGQMTSTAIGGLAPCAISLVDVRGLRKHRAQHADTAKWTERVARRICVEYGSTASMCAAAAHRRGDQEWGIHGTTTKAIRIGEAVRRAQRRHEDAVAAILAVEPGVLLFKGRLGLRRAVLRRLHRREEPVGRQPVRVRGDHVRRSRCPPSTSSGC